MLALSDHRGTPPLSSAVPVTDHALVTDASLAPDLVGPHPDDAARWCLERGLELKIDNADLVSSYWGHG